MKTAVIMAAGKGTRFGNMTSTLPKGFVKCGTMSMIERSIQTLMDCGIERIIIGTGYLKEKYEELQRIHPQIECVHSPRYAETNSMYTLWNCKDTIGDDDFLLLESDLIFERKAITSLIENNEIDAMLVSPVTKFQDQYYVERDAQGFLTNCSTSEDDINPCGELVGIHKLSNSFYKLMCNDYENKILSAPNLGYEYELLFMSQNIRPMHVLRVDGLKWYEIDDINDLQYAETHVLPFL